MDNDAVFAASAVNRRAMADLLEGLNTAQLSTPSLCGDWDVQTVGAHLASAITTKLSVFAVELVRHLGSFDRANSATARKESRRGIDATIAKLRANAESRFTPPGNGPRAPLTDVLVHLGDIARPLGLAHQAPEDHVRVALEFVGGSPIGFVKRGWLTDLQFVADDLDLTIGGRGAELHGRGVDLMMAMCGRSTALAGLTGSGVSTLQARLG